jgi:hypothetical protein
MLRNIIHRTMLVCSLEDNTRSATAVPICYNWACKEESDLMKLRPQRRQKTCMPFFKDEVSVLLMRHD